MASARRYIRVSRAPTESVLRLIKESRFAITGENALEDDAKVLEPTPKVIAILKAKHPTDPPNPFQILPDTPAYRAVESPLAKTS